jgi:uncharacterized protein YndB with AHSA1/START domain
MLMPENEVGIDAACERVFAVLADGPRYHEWVMGAADVRAADEEWPAPGSRIHHSTGVGKLRNKLSLARLKEIAER